MAFQPVQLEKDGQVVTANSAVELTNLRFGQGYKPVKPRKPAPKPAAKTEDK